MQTVSPRLNVPQSRFLALPHKFRAFVAGFGSGMVMECEAIATMHEFARKNRE